MNHPPLRLALRGALCLFGVVALLGACGDDDDDAGDETTTTTEEETTTTEEETTTTKAEKTTTSESDGGIDTDDACSLLDPAVIEDATGMAFEETQSTATSCLYQAEDGSAVALNLADVSADPQAGLAGAKTTCEPGSAEDITVAGAGGAFSCLVSSGGQSIPTVAGVAKEGSLVVITGASADTSLDTDTVIAALVEILESVF